MNINTFSQVTPVASSAEKFNERGLSENSDYVSSNEIISDYDGNLLIKYQTPLNFPEDLSAELSIVYNTNVAHRTFNFHDNNHNGYMINAPEWIIGYKGIALQTLNFETNYLVAFQNGNTNYGEEVPLLIPGYHFTNNLWANNLNPGSKDFIQLLMADGTIKILQNIDPVSVGRSGLYADKNIESPGIAKVEIYNYPNPVGRIQHFRKIWYKPGDGLTYFFEEEPVEYKDDGSAFYPSRILENPKITYLKKIISSSGDELDFIYSNQLGTTNITYGRKLFIGIKSNRRTSHSSDYELQMTYEWNNYLQSIKVNNYNFDDFLKLHVQNSNTELFNITRNSTRSRILYLNRVEDKMGRYDDFVYYPLTDAKVKRLFNYTSDYSRTFNIDYKFYLLRQINYYGGRVSEFEYFGQTFSGINAVLYFHFQEQHIGTNITAAFRDCFTNFMIQKRKTFNLIQPIRTENYSYSRIGTGGILSAAVNNIITTILIENNLTDNSSPSAIIKEKTFSKYNVHTLDYFLGDANAIIKLDKEKVSGGAAGFFEKIYSYDIGVLQNSYYNGTFRLNSDQINRNDGTNPSDVLSSSYTYTYTTINCRNQQSTLILTKKINKSVEKTTNNLKNLIVLDNFLSSSVDLYPSLSSTYFFKIGSLAEEKTYSGSLVKSNKKYYYNTSGEFVGKVNQEVDVLSENSTTQYDYYTASTNYFYRGFLKSKVNIGTSFKKEYFYPVNTSGADSLISESVAGNVIKYDGTILNKSFNHYGFQLKPFKTVTYFNNYSTTTPGNQNLTGTTNFEIYNNSSIINNGVNPHIIKHQLISFSNSITHDYHSFLSQPVILNNKLINDGVLTILIKTDVQNPSGLIRDLSIHGITEPYSGGKLNYQSQQATSITLSSSSLSGYITVNINLKDFLINLQGSNKNLYGFKFKAFVDEIGELKFLISGNPQFNITADNISLGSDIIYSSYDKKGNLKFEINGNSNYSQYSYDAMGRILYSDQPYSFTDINNSNHSSIYEYFDLNNYIIETNRANNNPASLKNIVTKKEFDSQGNLLKISIKNDTGSFITQNEKKYNYLGLNFEDISGTGIITKYTYDYLSRPKSVQLAGLTPETILYNWQSGTIANGTTSKTFYGIKTITDPAGKLNTIYYDKIGNTIARKSGTNTPLIYNLDNIYRTTSFLTPGGKTITYTYDSYGLVNSKISPDEGDYKYKYDKFGNLRFVFHTTAIQSEIVFHCYDDFNNLISTGVYAGTLTAYNALNANNHYSFETDTSKLIIINMYDNFNPSGIFANVSYTGLPSLTNLKGTLVATAFRDKAGQSWSYKVFSYNPLDYTNFFAVKSGTDTWRKIFTQYDNIGKVNSENINNNYYFWYNYDSRGRLAEITSSKSSGGTQSIEAHYDYNNDDQVTNLSFPSISNALKRNTNFTYESSSRLKAINYSNKFFYDSLNYYDNGNILTQQIINAGNAAWPALNFSYLYNDLNMLASAGNTPYGQTFIYDNDGNFLNKNNNSGANWIYEYYSGTNKLWKYKLGTTHFQYSYDYKGNLLQDTKRGLTINANDYDIRNLPLKVTKGTEVYSYNYDDQGNRIRKSTPSFNEIYLRDHTGAERAVYNFNSGNLKFVNIYGNGLIGRIEFVDAGVTPPPPID